MCWEEGRTGARMCSLPGNAFSHRSFSYITQYGTGTGGGGGKPEDKLGNTERWAF